MPDPDRSLSLADELFGGSSDPAATGPIRRSAEDEPLLRRPPTGHRAPRRHRRAGRVATAAVPILLVLAVAGLWAGSDPEVIPGRAIPGDPGGTAAAGSNPAGSNPAVTARATPGLDLAVRATRTDTDCAAHSYGRVRDFLATHPCQSVQRALYLGADPGGPVVVAVATVEMASEADAAQLQKLADTDGTGNISDLLREGVTFDGAPERLSDASYASQRRGPVLVIVEAAAASGAARPLDSLAEAALEL
ncbi:MAG TPA: hypothetical protein VHH34_20900, partial [Pseudonocardiaceae bacterium]|nr:hypothetical protein [Pseudonocardiaceae bacterium]